MGTTGLTAGAKRRGRCRHCRRCAVHRPRGLCWGCYKKPGVRDLYPVGSANPLTAKHAGRGVGHKGVSPPPSEPTDTPPGSLARMKVIRRRILRGESVSHPDDSRVRVPGLERPFEHHLPYQHGHPDLLADEPPPAPPPVSPAPLLAAA